MIDWWGSEEAVPGNSWIGGAWRRIRGKQVVQRPTGDVGNEDNHSLIRKEVFGGDRLRRWLPLLSRVKEGCGSCASRLDLLDSASKLEWGLSVCNAGTEDFIMFGLGSMCAWNSSVLVTWTAGRGNDSCWTSDLEERRPLQTVWNRTRTT